MHIIADLHIHSRYSRATSKSLDFVSLAHSALAKGIHLLGTGDFTHPGWLDEIERQLEPAEPGLFRLRPDYDAKAREGLPGACQSGWLRFVLEVEISNIYKRDGSVRKNHNLVFMPSGCVARTSNSGRPFCILEARCLSRQDLVLERPEHWPHVSPTLS